MRSFQFSRVFQKATYDQADVACKTHNKVPVVLRHYYWSDQEDTQLRLAVKRMKNNTNWYWTYGEYLVAVNGKYTNFRHIWFFHSFYIQSMRSTLALNFNIRNPDETKCNCLHVYSLYSFPPSPCYITFKLPGFS